MQKYIYLLIFILIVGRLSSQNKCIIGYVYDSETKESLTGVSVYIKNTVIGTTTDMLGHFNIKNPPVDSATVVFSFIGYESYEIKVVLTETVDLRIELVPDAISLETVVISTSKNDITNFVHTIPASIVSKKAITETCIQNIADILVREPAVSMAGVSYHRSPSIRGLARKRVVVMVDGEKISAERNVGPPGTYVNPLDIERIEILRGPYSTLYGSDAVGGVVNIITKDYSKPLTNKYVGGTFAGNFNSINKGYNANLLLNTKLTEKLFFHISAGKRKADSYKDSKDNEVQGTNFDEQNLTGKFTFQPNRKHKLQLNVFLSKADSIGKSAYSDSVNALHPTDNHYKFGLNYSWRYITPWLSKMSIRASRHRHEIKSRIYNYTKITNPSPTVVNKRKNLYNNDYVYQHDFHFIINKKLKLLAGFDAYQRDDIHIDEIMLSYRYDSVSDNYFLIDTLLYEGPQDTIIAQAYQRSLGVFVQANYILSNKFAFNGGIRWNDFKTHAQLVQTTQMLPYDYSKNVHTTETKKDDAFSGNIGVSYMLKENINITGNIGQAFRVPATRELFVTTMTPGGVTIANDSLKPEKSLNIDIGIKIRKKSGNFSFSLFRNKIHDMVILNWNSLHTTGKFENKNAILYGGEFVFNYSINKKISVLGNISKIYGYETNKEVLTDIPLFNKKIKTHKRNDNDEVLMDIPPLQINLQTKYFILEKKLWTALAGRYSAKQSEFVTGDVPTDDFFVLDFFSGFNYKNLASINFSIKNILNENYREHNLFGWMRNPGRSFNIGINLNF